jgi:hypothetical protein
MRGLLASLILMPVLVLATPASAASYMVGTWFGHGQPQDKNSMYIDRMRADGSWRGEYRSCMKVKGKPLPDQVQEGHWTLQGDTLSLRVDTVDGLRAPRTDLYKMLAHTATTQKYISLSYNYPYTPEREPDDFQMPSCQLIS